MHKIILGAIAALSLASLALAQPNMSKAPWTKSETILRKANVQCGYPPMTPSNCTAVCVCENPYNWQTCHWTIVCR